ncbi:expressed unknown protein [Seminavis robusta]|uniref:Uncharacterized protein n=1 Tax=Seminavis robusta TaxID=568900 RepID=A0A9N8ECN2_9STRA|nr:expressed unknown protein [Seminavis robusta]|eukprot:Sro980_g227330.1 n/a (317) ;mRNA; r:1784-2734
MMKQSQLILSPTEGLFLAVLVFFASVDSFGNGFTIIPSCSPLSSNSVSRGVNNPRLPTSRIPPIDRRGEPKTSLTMLPLFPKFGEKKNGMEVGIQTAQLLMDSRRRERLKKNMKVQFPMVSDAVIDSCIDITAHAFTQVAPEQLQIALRPGGMDRVRPDLEQVIVSFALEQSVVQKIPVLDAESKRKLVEALVGMALDYVLKDAEEVLTAPEVRLEALEEQIREVHAMMGRRQLFLYRVRHNAKEIVTGIVISLAALVIYQQRQVPMVAKVLAALGTAFSKLHRNLSVLVPYGRTFVTFLWQQMLALASFLQKKVM